MADEAGPLSSSPWYPLAGAQAGSIPDLKAVEKCHTFCTRNMTIYMVE
ncbi:hypothetical protein [Mesorhizobium sp. M0159]